MLEAERRWAITKGVTRMSERSETNVSADRLTPHQRIMRAAHRGTGLRLTANEVELLALDDAIVTRAISDDEGESNPDPCGRSRW